MSIQTEISRLQTLRNSIRTKLISLGLLSNANATLADCQTALDGVDLYTGGNTITSNGAVACKGKYMAENLTVEVTSSSSSFLAAIDGTGKQNNIVYARATYGGVEIEEGPAHFVVEAGSEVSCYVKGKKNYPGKVFLNGAVVYEGGSPTGSGTYKYYPDSSCLIELSISASLGRIKITTY